MIIVPNRGRKKNRNFFLAFYFMYMLDPFFINSVMRLHRLVYYIIAITPVVVFIVEKQWNIKTKNAFKLFFELALIYTLWSFLMSGILGGDFWYASDYIKWIFKIINSCSLFIIWKNLYKKNRVTSDFETIFVNAVLLYILFSILFLLLPSLKTFWISFIYNDKQPLYIIQDSSYATRYGPAGWSSFSEAYMSLFGSLVLIGQYLRRSIPKKVFSIKIIILTTGCFLYGRFALVIQLLFLGIFILYTIIKEKKIWVLGGACIFAATGIGSIIFLYNYSTATKDVITWVFEPLLNFYTNKTFAVNSTYELANMYKYFSPSVHEILVGSGKWYELNGMPYKYTDVGFMRNIYFSGLLGSILLYGTDIYLINIFAKIFAEMNRGKGKRMMFILLLIILISADLKGSMAITFIRYLFPLILANFYYQSHRKIEIE